MLEFIDDLVNHPDSAITKGIIDNLARRGEAAAKAPAAIAETLRKHGPTGLLKAIGGARLTKPAPLSPGDVLRVGDIELRYEEHAKR